MPSPSIIPPDLRDPVTCRAAWRLQQDAYEIEAALIGSRGMQALNESDADLASNTIETFVGYYLPNDRGVTTLAGIVATEAMPQSASQGRRTERWITRLVVDPRFARRGIGRTLVQHVIDRSGTERLKVSTGSRNTPALRLYKSLGFIPTEHMQAPDGTPLTVLARSAQMHRASACPP